MSSVNPFAWEYYGENGFESLSTYLNATYKDVPNEVYEKTEKEIFFNEDPSSATPNIASVCDMDSICDSDLAIV